MHQEPASRPKKGKHKRSEKKEGAYQSRARNAVRRSLTMPVELAEQIAGIAKQQHISESGTLVSLLYQGIEARTERRKRFDDIWDQYSVETDPAAAEHLREELARITFGS